MDQGARLSEAESGKMIALRGKELSIRETALHIKQSPNAVYNVLRQKYDYSEK